jgi:hypothetical protein
LGFSKVPFCAILLPCRDRRGLFLRISVICEECSRLNNNSAVFYLDTIRDDGVYIGRCPRGHDNAVATQTLRHEMLFEVGLNAMRDAYYREAISSFAASVDRYYEFAIRVIGRHSKLPHETFDLSWKAVASASERQIGAYLFLYAAAFREAAPTLSRKMTELRNDVVHKGILPEKGDAVRFGAACYSAIQSGIHKLRNECLEDINNEMVTIIQETIAKYGDRFPRATQVTPTALNIIQHIQRGYEPFDRLLAKRGI